METPPKAKSNKEICTIRIMFPVESDEKALEYKHKIADVLADNPDANMQFSLIPMPSQHSIPS